MRAIHAFFAVGLVLAVGAGRSADAAIVDYQFTDPADLAPTTQTDAAGTDVSFVDGDDGNKDLWIFEDGFDRIRGGRHGDTAVDMTAGQPNDNTASARFTITSTGAAFDTSTASLSWDGFSGGGTRGNGLFAFYASTDGGTTFTDLGTFDDEADASIALGALANAVLIDFRIYGIKSSGSFDTESGLNSVTFSSAQIPEPASLALIGIGGLLMASRRRA